MSKSLQFSCWPSKPLSGQQENCSDFDIFAHLTFALVAIALITSKMAKSLQFSCWPDKGLLGQQENRSDFDIFAWSPQKCQNRCSFPVGPVSPYRANKKTAVILTFLRISPLPSWPSPWLPQKCQNHCSFPVGPSKGLLGPTGKLQWFWHFCASHLCPRGHRLDYLKNVKITAVFLLAR